MTSNSTTLTTSTTLPTTPLSPIRINTAPSLRKRSSLGSTAYEALPWHRPCLRTQKKDVLETSGCARDTPELHMDTSGFTLVTRDFPQTTRSTRTGQGTIRWEDDLKNRLNKKNNSDRPNRKEHDLADDTVSKRQTWKIWKASLRKPRSIRSDDGDTQSTPTLTRSTARRLGDLPQLL